MTAMSAGPSVACPAEFRVPAASYWVLDPDEPGTLTVLELGPSGRYREAATARGEEKFTAERPVPVTVIPTRLRDGLRP